ncbi:MAG: N-acetylmuramoyl-L-alanine amidase [Spirochaetaceae bacterium]|jgi:N-acetylmuramoyl-L-alanine amidase|nr:N-acetylmuramoyl-L-alanine amidase [Spirochaetaceae bacterium]
MPVFAQMTIQQTLDAIGPGATMSWDPLLRTGAFNAGPDTAAFITGDPGEMSYILVNYRQVYSAPSPYLENNQLYFPTDFVSNLQRIFGRQNMVPGTIPQAQSQAPSQQVPGTTEGTNEEAFHISAIIIDPGHGGKDPGAKGKHSIEGKTVEAVEKNIVLEVSLRLEKLLKAAYPGKKILMTRRDDSFPSLEERVDIANNVPIAGNEAIIYISVHANASLNEKANGFEVWYLRSDYKRNLVNPDDYADRPELIPIMNDMLDAEFNNESDVIARSILSRYAEEMKDSMQNRGIKEEDWFVVRNSRMPAVLVELGFVTNQDDARIMTGEEGLNKMAKALYNGIGDFIKNFETQ